MVGTTGYFKCVFNHPWELKIQDIDLFTPCSNCTIEITIFKVWNPMVVLSGQTDNIKIGILQDN